MKDGGGRKDEDGGRKMKYGGIWRNKEEDGGRWMEVV